MIFKNILTAAMFNYNGFRNMINGKGRVQITLESLVECVPEIKNMRLILADNKSEDGSEKFLGGFPIGEKHVFPRAVREKGWYATSRNNLENLRRAISMTGTSYYWNIENDSYFFNRNGFLNKAISALEAFPDISIIHLRRWTPLDCKDKPGAPQNHCRVEEIRNMKGLNLYILKRSEQDNVWVNVVEGLPKEFVPYSAEDDFMSLQLGEDPGCVRKTGDGWQRLIEDHYNTYTTHGYVARSAHIRQILDEFSPKTEKEMSIAFKKRFKAARLDEDAFISFGWNTRIHPSEEEITKMFEWAEKHNYSSVIDYGR